MSTIARTNCKAATSFTSVDLREPVQLRIRDGDAEPITLPQLFKETVQKVPNSAAMVFQNTAKEWVTITYQQYWDKSRQIARAFIKLGLKARTSCGILAFACSEWYISQMAAIMVGGVSAGIYLTNSAEACHHILGNSCSTICIVDDSVQMEKIKSIKHRLPLLKAIVQINGPFADFVDSEEGFYSWAKMEKMGIEDDDYLEQQLEDRLKGVVANECALLIYTSGTVGMPKGVMLTHDSVIVMSSYMIQWERIDFGNEVIVCYLPLNHIAAQIMDFFVSIRVGATVYFADRNALKDTLINTLQVARPTRFFGVPRVYEKIAEKLMAVEREMSWLPRLILTTARKIVKNHNLSLIKGEENISSISSLTYALASTFMKRARAAIGFDRNKFTLSSAASLDLEIKEFFLGYDIWVIEGFGMSEASGIITINWNLEEFMSCGKPIPGLELKLDNTDQTGHGEICIRGRTLLMGYLGRPETTKEALSEDGWLRTGDIGFLDTKGCLHISGRIKELIVTSGGENIPPVHIETLVKNELPGISNVMLIGDKRKFLTMLLSIKTVIDPETGSPRDTLQADALEWIRGLGLPYTTLSEVLNAGPCPKVRQSIQEGINRANAKALSNVHRVQKFAILPHDFTIKTGELGPTLKLRRNVVLKKYEQLIDGLYKGT